MLAVMTNVCVGRTTLLRFYLYTPLYLGYKLSFHLLSCLPIEELVHVSCFLLNLCVDPDSVFSCSGLFSCT